ncbi:IS1182 family transposase [Massilia antarctica]|uniref:IS1182 family transposase n=1 Tax=Massilia antarctica TaxID=2765360 RepID=A0AA49ABE2_9BURK|nr:IS1182 family transposase [Massilia antarctica]QPI52862.1 IS1182 family transposase [Massilia antarctica]
MSTAHKIAPDSPQFSLFDDLPGKEGRIVRTAVHSGRRFVTIDPRSIFIGTTRLEDHIKQAGQTSVFIVADLLDSQDFQAFEARYAATGRAPYSPRLMLGLILYGIMQGIHSLRDLQRLARMDLGCMWVAGGISPAHGIIGRFIVLHAESLTKDFFESLTAQILKATGSRSNRLAGDGTVIEAACSHYNLLKADALKERADAARRHLDANRADDCAKHEVQSLTECERIFEQRVQARKRSGRKTDTLALSAVEPEAIVQRQKRSRGTAPSYKPSVLANENRIVTAMALHPSSETKVIGAMLDQSARVTGSQPEELLLDAGYFDDSVIAATLERDVSLFCPEGQEPGVSKKSKVFHKSEFLYDAAEDTYRCPAGHTMLLLKVSGGTEKKRAFRSYGTSACGNCAVRSQCTKGAKRKIERHPEDEQRDALRQVMQQRQVRSLFSQRQAMVEPVFSHLRGRQNLNRFRRRGLRAVKREFALHVIAYNLARAVALLKRISPLFAALFGPLNAAIRLLCRHMSQLHAAIPAISTYRLISLGMRF